MGSNANRVAIRMVLRIIYFFAFSILLIDFVRLSFGLNRMVWWELLLLFGMLFLSYLLRYYASKMWLLAVLHLAMGAGILLIPNRILCIVLFEIAELTMLFRASKHFVKGNDLKERYDIPWPIFVVAVVELATGIYLHRPEIVKLSYTYSLFLFLFYFVILYMDGIDLYVQSTRDTTGIPMKRMLSVNSLIVFSLMLVTLVAVLVGNKLGFGEALKNFFLAVLSLLKVAVLGVVWGIKAISGLFRSSPEAEAAVEEQTQRIEEVFEEADLINPIWDMILRCVILVVISLILFKLLYALIKFVMYAKRGLEASEIQEIKKEKKKKDRKTGIRRASLMERIARRNTPEERARRIYKKRILGLQKDFRPEKYETTADIEERAMEELKVQLPELTALYDAIRYGSVIPDRNYLEKMRKADSIRKEL